MENKTKGAGDDYPVIPQTENKTDGELLEEALIHIDKLNEELASLKEVVKELLPLAERMGQILGTYANDHYKSIIDRAKRLSDNK